MIVKFNLVVSEMTNSKQTTRSDITGSNDYIFQLLWMICIVSRELNYLHSAPKCPPLNSFAGHTIVMRVDGPSPMFINRNNTLGIFACS